MIATLLDASVRCVALSAIVWLCLKLPRLRNPHVQLTAWTVVLVASLLMPAVTRLAAFVIPPAPVTAPIIDAVFALRLEEPSLWRIDVAVSPQAIEVGSAESTAGASAAIPGVKPEVIAAILYVIIAGVFLARMVAGLLLTLRLVLVAKPLDETWVAGGGIRVSSALSAPATFGATILLPQDYVDWSENKLAAVLAHETAHARRGDFYIQVAAMLNRAIFWFNPLSWWLQRRLTQLAEIASDDAALARIKDRPLYAEILLELTRASPIGFGAVAMARPATVQARIERILTESSAPLEIGQRGRAMLIGATLPFVAIAASPLTASSSISLRTDEAGVEGVVRERIGSDRAFYARDASSTTESGERALAPPVGNTAESAEHYDRTETSLALVESKPAVIMPTLEVEPKAAQAAALTSVAGQSIEVNAVGSDSTARPATVPLEDRPVAQGAVETKGVQLGGAKSPLTIAAALVRFVAAAPVLRSASKDRSAGRVAEQVGKTERHVDGKSDTLSVAAPLARTQEAAAVAPDICVHSDWTGQRAFLICHPNKARNPSVSSFQPASSWDGAWTGYWSGNWWDQGLSTVLSTVTIKDGAVVEYISSGRRATAKATQISVGTLSFDTGDSRITLTRTGQNSASALKIDTFSGRPQGHSASSNGAIFQRQ